MLLMLALVPIPEFTLVHSEFLASDSPFMSLCTLASIHFTLLPGAHSEGLTLTLAHPLVFTQTLMSLLPTLSRRHA